MTHIFISNTCKIVLLKCYSFVQTLKRFTLNLLSMAVLPQFPILNTYYMFAETFANIENQYVLHFDTCDFSRAVGVNVSTFHVSHGELFDRSQASDNAAPHFWKRSFGYSCKEEFLSNCNGYWTFVWRSMTRAMKSISGDR